MVQVILTSFSILLTLLLGVSAQDCGSQAGGALCPGGLCCSQFGWCGSTDPWCGDGCQSQCGGDDGGDSGDDDDDDSGDDDDEDSGGGGVVAEIITREMFEEMLKHRDNGACPARGFYTYDSFISAAKTFPDFGTTGDNETRKREIAAFLGQTSHETTGGWAAAPDGPYAWGYCFSEEINQGSAYCAPSTTWPCAPGQKYFGRGPIQLSWNYNYGPCGLYLGQDLLNNPGIVSQDPVIAFRAAFWFWMTPQLPKPSCHDVMTGVWSPTAADVAAGRLPGYGMTTNIINGGLECGRGPDARVQSRIGFYTRYCDMLGVSTGDNLDCNNQRPFGFGLMDMVESM